MKISEQGVALIAYYEGFSAKEYVCPAGRRTIGYGHVLKSKESFPARGITRTKAMEMLQEDAGRAAVSVQRYVSVPLTQNQLDALTSFVFNIGAGAFSRSTLRKVINRGWHPEVPAQLMRWTYTGGRQLQGLVDRRKAEAELYGRE